MNLKKKVFCIIAMCVFMTGCNTSNEKKTELVADKATQQKTMTKVQNDVNEIMNKDYDYIIKNMGIPYCTTYYIDTDNIEEGDIYSLNDIRSATDFRLVYPKYSSDNELGKSALYIELHNNKVVEVQTYEFSKYDINLEDVNSNMDLIIDMYDENSSIQLNTVDSKDFKKYIGLELESLNNIVNIDLINFEVYDKYRENMVMGFFIDDKKEDTNNILTIYESNKVIEDIKILDESKVLDLVKNKLIK